MPRQGVRVSTRIHSRTPGLFGWPVLLNSWLSAPVWWIRRVSVPRIARSFFVSGRHYQIRRLCVTNIAALRVFFDERLPTSEHRFVRHPVDEDWLHRILGRRTLVAVGLFSGEGDSKAGPTGTLLIGYGLIMPTAWGWAQATYVVAPGHRAGGTGLYVLRCLLEIVFKIRHRLVSTILTENTPSIAMARAAGIWLRPLFRNVLLAISDQSTGFALEDSEESGGRYLGDDVTALEQSLLDAPEIIDCAIRERGHATVSDSLPHDERIVYLVSRQSLDPARPDWRFDLSARNGLPPLSFVPVHQIPLAADGSIAEDRLAQVPALDRDLASHFEEEIRERLTVNDVAVEIVQDLDLMKAQPPLSLGGLLPDLAPAGDISPESERFGICLPVSTASPTPTVDRESDAEVSRGPLAEGGGAPLILDDRVPELLGEVLERAALEHPEHGVFFLHADGSAAFCSYPELLEDAHQVLGGLRERGIGEGDKVIFQLRDNRSFLSAFWACVLGGIVPCPVSIPPSYRVANSGVQKLGNAWELLDQAVVICGQCDAEGVGSVPRVLGHEDANFSICVLDELRESLPAARSQSVRSRDLALLLLTSGSTGKPKAVMRSHRSLTCRSIAVNQHNGFTSDEVILNWMPLDHVGGIVMYHLRLVFLGCNQFHAPTAVILEAPLRWVHWIDRYRVTATGGLGREESRQEVLQMPGPIVGGSRHVWVVMPVGGWYGAGRAGARP
jgi:hypothetical protein